MTKNIFKLSIYFAVFIVIGAVAAYFFFEIIDFGKTGEAPLLVGKSITEATELMNKRELILSIEGQDYNNEIPEGHITKQFVEAGTKMRAGSGIGVVVSRGKRQDIFSIPSFEDQLLEEAKLTFSNLDIRLGKVTWVHSDSVEKGKIIAQRPLPGSVNSSEINLLVSLGSYDVMYRCPSFINMTIEDARLLSEKLGIKLIEQNEGTKVVSQRPEEGAIVRKGDSVDITLGSGRWMWF
jgi:serine/threonine-protein kinase